LGVELGRLLEFESLRTRYYDGVAIEERTRFLEARVYLGRAVKEGSLLSITNFETDGVRSSDSALASRVDPTGWPFLLTPEHSAATLAWGGGLLLKLPEHLSLAVNLDEERSAGAIDLRLAGLRGEWREGPLRALAWLSYDLLHARVALLHGELSLRAGRRWKKQRERAGVGEFGVQVESSTPIFDGDSIWNLFVLAPSDRLGLFYRARFASRAEVFAETHLLRFRDEAAFASSASYGSTLHASYKQGRLSLRARLGLEGGYGGSLLLSLIQSRWIYNPSLSLLLDASAGRLGDRFGVSGLFSSIKLGLRYRFDPSSRFGIATEFGTSPLLRANLRVYATLDISLDNFFRGGVSE